jgi:hypothetical protein
MMNSQVLECSYMLIRGAKQRQCIINCRCMAKFIFLFFGSSCRCTRLWSLRSIFGTALHSLCDSLCVKRTTDYMVTHARQIFDTAAADEHNTMLLQIVADAWNVGSNLNAVC